MSETRNPASQHAAPQDKDEIVRLAKAEQQAGIVDQQAVAAAAAAEQAKAPDADGLAGPRGDPAEGKR